MDEIKQRGYGIVDSGLPSEFLEHLRESFDLTLEEKRRRLRNEANHHGGRWQMHLPSREPFLRTDLIAHPAVLSVVRELIGNDSVLSLVASVTALPGVPDQEPHQDSGSPFLMVTMPLVDVNEDNGPTEMWPGTHRGDPRTDAGYSRERMVLSKERIRELAEKVTSVRPAMKAGTFLIRDMRMIHRGTANRSKQSRSILTLIYELPPRHPVARPLVNAAAVGALAIRRWSRALSQGTNRRDWIDFGNQLGTLVERQAGSDRDHRRVIPAKVWGSLSEEARQLLRLASVEGKRPPWTLAGSWHFARTLVKFSTSAMPILADGESVSGKALRWRDQKKRNAQR